MYLLAGEVAARMKTELPSNARDVEVNQDPSKVWYELFALQLMQFRRTRLGECHTKRVLSQGSQLLRCVFYPECY